MARREQRWIVHPPEVDRPNRWWEILSITIREVTTALAPGEAIYTLPISWFWLWGVAAPFNVQEATP